MTKIILNDVGSLIDATTAANTINTNSAVIVTAFDNTLSRDGTGPNQMAASIDMNNNRILNLPLPVSLAEPLRLTDAATLNGGGSIIVNPLPVGGTVGQVLTKQSSTNFDALWNTPTNVIQPIFTGGRLTLTASTPVTTTDVTGAVTLYYAPMVNNYITIWSGSVLNPTLFTASSTDTVGLTLNLGANWLTNTDYDCFVVNDGGTIRLGTGPAWTSHSGRGTGGGTTELQLFNGIWTNKNIITIRYSNSNTVSIAANQATYIGTVGTVAAGQLEDSAAKRYVWNCYNQVNRYYSTPIETTDNWNYTTAAFRQANNNTNNQINTLVGLAGNAIEIDALALASPSAGSSIFVTTGIGFDSTTVNSAQLMSPSISIGTSRTALFAKYAGYPPIGRHFYAWLEYSGASGTTTWYGDNGNPLLSQCGILGWMQN